MRTDMIVSYIRSLSSSLGIRPVVDEEPLYALYEQQDFVGLVRSIRLSMRLDIRTKIGFVNSGGPQNAPAWIAMPTTMALYGSPYFSRTVITVYLRKNFLATERFETIVLAIAHEFSHVVLHALHHPLKHEETAVDLAAMILGYRDFYRKGCAVTQHLEEPPPHHHSAFGRIRNALAKPTPRRVLVQTSSFGYLTRAEVAYAAIFIDGMP